MSVIFKAKLKAAKTAIAEKNYDYSYDLCHDLLELDDSNYNVHILLGVSCQHMSKWEEGERVYKASMSMPKANILAWQGICALYEASQDTDKYKQALRDLRDRHLSEGSEAKAWETTSKLIALSEQSGDKRELISTLREVTKRGQYGSLLLVTGVDPAPPKLVDVLKQVCETESELDQKTIELEVNKRKTRLGAGPISKVRRDVRVEVWSQSGLLNTLGELISLYLEEGDEEERLVYEERYFAVLLERLVVVDDAEEKEAMLEEARKAAWDLASNGRCQGAFEHLIEVADSNSEDGDLKGLIEGYLQLFGGSGRLSKSAQVWMNLQDANYADLLELAQQGRGAADDSPFAYVMLTQAAIRSRSYRVAIDTGIAARQVIKQFEDSLGIKLWRSWLAIDLSVADGYVRLGSENATDAELLYRKCLEADPGNAQAILGLGLSLCMLGNYDESRQLLSTALNDDAQNHLALGGLGYVELKEGNTRDAAEYFQRAIAIKPSYASHHVNLGNAYWQMGGKWRSDKQYAYSSWIQAARIDPSASETFCGLGKWYQQYGNDTERAKKCFAKAVSTDHANGDAGQALAEIYLAEGSDDLCETLLIQSTEAQHGQKWAWKHMGFLRLRQEKSEAAIVAFRNALSIDRTDRLCWEGLCEAYMAIGRMHTSVKVAQKVVELDPSCVSGHWLGARASMSANDLDSSLAYFDSAIECLHRSDNVEALAPVWSQTLVMGKAECLIACSERWYLDGLFGRVIDASNGALETVLPLVEQSADEDSGESQPGHLVWKIVCSACIWITRVQSMLDGREDLVRMATVSRLIELAQHSESCFAVPDFLSQTSQIASTESGNEEELDGGGEYVRLLFSLAERAARQCILVATSAALASVAWADLAHIYYERNSQLHPALLETAKGNKSSEDGGASDSPPLLEAAANCAQAAVQLDPANAKAYGVQGVVAAHSQHAALAQHAFIMASRLSPTSAMPWANLGFLYLHHGDMELANKAFSKAQMTEPEFIPGWLGQAMIAETLGYAESLELYANCILPVGVSKAIGDYGFAKQVWRSAVERNNGDKGVPAEHSAQEGAAAAKGGAAAGDGSGSDSTLSFSEQSRLVTAIYSARRFVARTGDKQGAGSHLLGLLLEQNGEFENAAEAYAVAHSRVAGNKDRPAGCHLREWIALAHLGRAQCSAGQYIEAADTYEMADALILKGGIQVDKDVGGVQVLYYTLGHSLALFFSERLGESLGKFEEALEKSATVPQLRPIIAVMLAQVLWALGTDEHRALARQHLLEVMSESSEFLPGLSTLFAIGLQQGDGELIAATYPELVKVRNRDLGHEVAKLEMYLALLREDPAGGRRAMSKALYRNPSDASLWLLMGRFEAACEQHSFAAAAAGAALSLFRQAVRGSLSWSGAPSRAMVNSASLDVVVSASTIKSRALANGSSSSSSDGDQGADNKRARHAARSAARRAVMYQPWSLETWVCLQDAIDAA
ncbi:TPR-like protein [Martensiomyces pterosporus]|nr:TPR-like protein [Martensiomyces pterosporus]